MSASIAGRGLIGDPGMVRAMRQGPPAMTMPPDLFQAPAVFGLNGFGTGAGAFIRNQGRDADAAQGLVMVRCGLNPSAGGILQLSFPAGVTVGQYVLLADWWTTTLAYATPVLMATWNATRPILPQETLIVAYQWSVSV